MATTPKEHSDFVERYAVVSSGKVTSTHEKQRDAFLALTVESDGVVRLLVPSTEGDE